MRSVYWTLIEAAMLTLVSIIIGKTWMKGNDTAFEVSTGDNNKQVQLSSSTEKFDNEDDTNSKNANNNNNRPHHDNHHRCLRDHSYPNLDHDPNHQGCLHDQLPHPHP